MKRISLLAMMLLLAASLATAAPVAMVTDLAGTVTKGGSALPLLTELEAGQTVEVEKGGRVVLVWYANSSEHSISGPARVEIAADGPKGGSGDARQLIDDESVKLSPVGLAQASLVMRSAEGEENRIELAALVGTRTLDPHPEFGWKNVEGNSGYRFELTDDTMKTLVETVVEGNSYRLPKEVELKPDVLYTWEVETRLPGGKRVSAWGDFTIVPPTERTRVERLRPATDASVSERVVFATLLESLELFDEARAYWTALAKERPDQAVLKRLSENR